MEKIKEYVRQHCQNFKYTITPSEEDEIAVLYRMNNKIFDKSSLILHIERFIASAQNQDGNKENKDWRRKRRASVCAQKIFVDELTEELDLPKIEKTCSTRSILLHALGTGLTKDILSFSQRINLVDYMIPVCVGKGTVFLREGDICNEMYIIEEGKFDVFVGGQHRSELTSGTGFGEIALLHSVPRTATVIASEDSKVWEVKQSIFSAIRIRDRLKNRELIKNALFLSGLFSNDSQLELACLNCTCKYITTGTWVSVYKEFERAVVLTRGMIKGEFDSRVDVGDLIDDNFTAMTEMEIAMIQLPR